MRSPERYSIKTNLKSTAGRFVRPVFYLLCPADDLSPGCFFFVLLIFRELPVYDIIKHISMYVNDH